MSWQGLNIVCANICPFPVLSGSGSLYFPDPVGIITIVILNCTRQEVNETLSSWARDEHSIEVAN